FGSKKESRIDKQNVVEREPRNSDVSERDRKGRHRLPITRFQRNARRVHARINLGWYSSNVQRDRQFDPIPSCGAEFPRQSTELNPYLRGKRGPGGKPGV